MDFSLLIWPVSLPLADYECLSTHTEEISQISLYFYQISPSFIQVCNIVLMLGKVTHSLKLILLDVWADVWFSEYLYQLQVLPTIHPH